VHVLTWFFLQVLKQTFGSLEPGDIVLTQVGGQLILEVPFLEFIILDVCKGEQLIPFHIFVNSQFLVHVF
jgi:hypothetical protein